MERDTETGPSQEERIAALPENLAILKMENENIMALAAAHPRNMAQIKKDLEETLAAFPTLAEESIYNKPVGKVVDVRCTCGNHFEQAVTRNNDEFTCPKCGNAKHDRKAISAPRQKFARGLSIRAAETMAEVYGFNKTRSGVTMIDADTVKVEATFVDYQRGRIWQDDTVLSKSYKSRAGATYRHSDDRFYGLVVKAEKSRLIREVINRSINAGLKAWFESRCEEIQGALLTDDAVEKIVKSFSAFNVTPEMLDGLIGRTRSQGWTATDRKTLLGVYTALKTNETTVAEVFYFDQGDAETGTGARAKKSDLNDKLDATKTATETPKETAAKETASGKFADLKSRIESNKSNGDWLKLKDEVSTLFGKGELTAPEAGDLQALLESVKPPM